MKIQFASDLHLEFYADDINVDFESILTINKEADILILAGDIGYPEDSITARFFEWCCSVWPHVVWILGNHEYYNKKYNPVKLTMNDKELISEKLCEKFTNLHLLQNGRLILDKFPTIKIIGTTLWTDVPLESRRLLINSMNDFNYIYSKCNESFNLNTWNNLHIIMRQFIEDELYDAFNRDQKVVVVTHHLPTYKMILPIYQSSPINAAFAANCDHLLEHSSVAAWICGHSHGSNEIEIKRSNQTRVKCYLNSRGYKFERNSITMYNPNKLIEIE